MPRTRREPKDEKARNYKPVFVQYDWVNSQPTNEKCYRLTDQQVALLLSVTEQFHWPTRWIKDNREKLSASEVEFIHDIAGELEARLTLPENCDTGEPVEPPEMPPTPPVTGIFDDSLADILSQYSEDEILDTLECLGVDMCNCGSLASRIKIENGTVYVYDKDDCGCLKWIPIGSTSGSEVPDTVGDMIDDQGNPTGDYGGIGTGIGVDPEYSQDLTRCGKATALVSAHISIARQMSEDAIDWYQNIQDEISILSVATGIITALAPQLKPLVKIPTVAAVVLKFTDVAWQEINALANNEDFVKLLICTVSAGMSVSDRITGTDISNYYIALQKSMLNLEVVNIAVMNEVFKIFNTTQLADIANSATRETDCGCPQIANPQAPPSETEPDTDYTWCRVFDFEISQYGVALNAASGGGVYVAGVGIEGTIVGWGNGSSWGIGMNKNTNGSANVTSVDLFYEYVDTSENPANPQADNNKQHWSIPAATEPANFIVTKAKWGNGFSRWQGNSNGVGVQVEWYAGWDNTVPINITGVIRIKKMIIRGLGTDTMAGLPEGERGVVCA